MFVSALLHALGPLLILFSMALCISLLMWAELYCFRPYCLHSALPLCWDRRALRRSEQKQRTHFICLIFMLSNRASLANTLRVVWKHLIDQMWYSESVGWQTGKCHWAESKASLRLATDTSAAPCQPHFHFTYLKTHKTSPSKEPVRIVPAECNEYLRGRGSYWFQKLRKHPSQTGADGPIRNTSSCHKTKPAVHLSTVLTLPNPAALCKHPIIKAGSSPCWLKHSLESTCLGCGADWGSPAAGRGLPFCSKCFCFSLSACRNPFRTLKEVNGPQHLR